MKATQAVSTIILLGLALGMTTGCGSSDPEAVAPVDSLSERQALVQEAYLYGLPLLLSYQSMAAEALDATGPDFRAPLNQLKNNVPVENAEDTVASSLWMDLRAEPMVLTVPALAGEWVYSVQLQDLLARRFGQIGTLALGNEAGSYLIAGPAWTGTAPRRINKVFRSDSDFAHAVYTTRSNPEDAAAALAIQSQFKAQPLSTFIVSPVVDPAPVIPFPPWSESFLGDDFIAALNVGLAFLHPEEAEIAQWARWAPIGVGLGKPFDFQSLSPETQNDIQIGVQSARASLSDAERNAPQ